MPIPATLILSFLWEAYKFADEHSRQPFEGMFLIALYSGLYLVGTLSIFLFIKLDDINKKFGKFHAAIYTIGILCLMICPYLIPAPRIVDHWLGWMGF